MEDLSQLTIKEIRALLDQVHDSDDPVLIQLEADPRKGVQTALKQKQKVFAKQEADRSNLDRMLQYERKAWQKGFQAIAGIDEVGRGPLAGPVVTAAVVLPQDFQLLGVKDSKQLKPVQRQVLKEAIEDQALSISYGIRSAQEIDQVNILEATKQAMLEAVAGLDLTPDLLLVDAVQLKTPIRQQSIIKGDDNSVSIACASILAKEKRDQMMVDYAKDYPHYAFEKNMGYGTKAHLEGLEKFGPCPIHRRSFAPVRQYS